MTRKTTGRWRNSWRNSTESAGWLLDIPSSFVLVLQPEDVAGYDLTFREKTVLGPKRIFPYATSVLMSIIPNRNRHRCNRITHDASRRAKSLLITNLHGREFVKMHTCSKTSLGKAMCEDTERASPIDCTSSAKYTRIARMNTTISTRGQAIANRGA